MGEFQGERDGPLLPLAGEFGGGEAVHREQQVVAMRADEALALASFPFTRLFHRAAKVGTARGAIVDHEGLLFPADLPLRAPGPGCQQRDKARPRLHQGSAGGDHHFLVRADLVLARAQVLQ